MGELPKFDRVEEIAIPIGKFSLGNTVLDAYPQAITDESYRVDGKHIGSNLVVFMRDAQGKYYSGLIKGLNDQDIKGDVCFKLVARKIRRDYPNLIPNCPDELFGGVVYLEQRLERGDEFLFRVDYSAVGDEMVYGRFLDYSVFCFKNSDGRRDVSLRRGNLSRARVLEVRNNPHKPDLGNENVLAKPLRLIRLDRFQRDERLIFRNKFPESQRT